MQEHPKREEPLSEELLESVMGATGGARSSGSTGHPGSYLDCKACKLAASNYAAGIRYRDYDQTRVDEAVTNGDPAGAGRFNKWSNESHQDAQKAYQEIAAHGHPDFPATLIRQRQNYRPQN